MVRQRVAADTTLARGCCCWGLVSDRNDARATAGGWLLAAVSWTWVGEGSWKIALYAYG